jgi:glucosamine 6-phosphate synthetase-like amidotransferase/phosphosugar isomerase protein
MCGIFGSKNKNTFLDLYNLNKERGDFSYGGYYFSNNHSYLFRSKSGPVSIEDLPEADYYLGHTRAPTGSQAPFSVWQCHPFTSFKYLFAHNGIINTRDLEEKYKRTLAVDSMWLATAINEDINTNIIQEDIKGTYAVWAVDVESRDVNLFRCANPIHWHAYTQSFSSIKPSSQYETLEEGNVYTFNPTNITQNSLRITGKFKYNSPYFIPGE